MHETIASHLLPRVCDAPPSVLGWLQWGGFSHFLGLLQIFSSQTHHSLGRRSHSPQGLSLHPHLSHFFPRTSLTPEKS